MAKISTSHKGSSDEEYRAKMREYQRNYQRNYRKQQKLKNQGLSPVAPITSVFPPSIVTPITSVIPLQIVAPVPPVISVPHVSTGVKLNTELSLILCRKKDQVEELKKEIYLLELAIDDSNKTYKIN